MLSQVSLQFCQCFCIAFAQEKHRVRGAAQLPQRSWFNQGCQYLGTHNSLCFGTPWWSVRILVEFSQELFDLMLLRGCKRGYEIRQSNITTGCTRGAGNLSQFTFFLQCQENL